MKKPSLQYRPLSANPNHATQENEYPKDIGAIYDDHNGAAPRTPSIRPFAANPEKKIGVPHWKCQYGYGSIPINTIFSGMNIHLPAILGFTRYQGFDPSPYDVYWPTHRITHFPSFSH